MPSVSHSLSFYSFHYTKKWNSLNEQIWVITFVLWRTEKPWSTTLQKAWHLSRPSTQLNYQNRPHYMGEVKSWAWLPALVQQTNSKQIKLRAMFSLNVSTCFWIPIKPFIMTSLSLGERLWARKLTSCDKYVLRVWTLDKQWLSLLHLWYCNSMWVVCQARFMHIHVRRMLSFRFELTGCDGVIRVWETL